MTLKQRARAIMEETRKRVAGDDYADAQGRDAAVYQKVQALNAKFQALADDFSRHRTKRPTELGAEDLDKFEGSCRCLEWNDDFKRVEEGLPF